MDELCGAKVVHSPGTVRTPTRKPSLARGLTRALWLPVVALAGSCLNPRPEDDPSANGRSGVDPSGESPALDDDYPDDVSSPRLPIAPANPSAPNPNGLEGETPSSAGEPGSIAPDAGAPSPDGGPDAGS
jgi:hypothetical protein